MLRGRRRRSFITWQFRVLVDFFAAYPSAQSCRILQYLWKQAVGFSHERVQRELQTKTKNKAKKLTALTLAHWFPHNHRNYIAFLWDFDFDAMDHQCMGCTEFFSGANWSPLGDDYFICQKCAEVMTSTSSKPSAGFAEDVMAPQGFIGAPVPPPYHLAEPQPELPLSVDDEFLLHMVRFLFTFMGIDCTTVYPSFLLYSFSPAREPSRCQTHMSYYLSHCMDLFVHGPVLISMPLFISIHYIDYVRRF